MNAVSFPMRLRLLAPLIVLWAMLVLPMPPAFAAMDYAKQVLIGADFSNREMQGVTFNLTNLREADLSGSDLQGASQLQITAPDLHIKAPFQGF